MAGLASQLDPMGGQTLPDDPDEPNGKWLRLANQARGTAIAGGSTYIQRNILAERMLGLPRG